MIFPISGLLRNKLHFPSSSVQCLKKKTYCPFLLQTPTDIKIYNLCHIIQPSFNLIAIEKNKIKFCSVGPDHTNSRENISRVLILANTTLKATFCMAMAKSNISKIIGSRLTSSYLNESRLYLVKLLEYQSDSNLTFNLTFQFNKCKNIVGNSAPNMLTSVTFTICKCSNF